jgi:ribosome-associated translation inhibitor RaiA
VLSERNALSIRDASELHTHQTIRPSGHVEQSGRSGVVLASRQEGDEPGVASVWKHRAPKRPPLCVELMRIQVVGEDESIDAQARTYAEYRVFAALARHTPRVRSARVVLRRDERRGRCDTVVCAVTVALDPSGSVRTRAFGPHAYSAINSAVERIGDLMRRRTAQRLSS